MEAALMDVSGLRLNRREVLKRTSGFGILACLAGACGCRTAPMTGRKQLLFVPEDQEVALGLQAYEETVNKTPASDNQRLASLVSQVGHRLAAVANRSDFQWDFRLLKSDEQNAFCLPGGKVAVYEGILPICQSEAGLAVVMSHEVAHALARHGGERMSQNAAVSGVQNAIGYVMQNQEEVKKEMFMKAYGLASEYGVLLPYSRKHELEADHIGVMLMADAGYDPAEAPRFWTRFGTAAGSEAGSKPPEFMSTHPSDQRRADELGRLLPEAQSRYASCTAPIGMGETI